MIYINKIAVTVLRGARFDSFLLKNAISRNEVSCLPKIYVTDPIFRSELFISKNGKVQVGDVVEYTLHGRIKHRVVIEDGEK